MISVEESVFVNAIILTKYVDAIKKGSITPSITTLTFKYNIKEKVQMLIHEIKNLLNNKCPNAVGKYKCIDNFRLWIINQIDATVSNISDFLLNQIKKNYDTNKNIKFNNLEKINNFVFHPFLLDNFIDLFLYEIFPNHFNKDFYNNNMSDNADYSINILVEMFPFFFSNSEKYVINFCNNCDKKYFVINGCICNKIFYCSKDCKLNNIYEHLIKCPEGIKELLIKDNNRLEKSIIENKIDLKKPIINGLTNIRNSCFINAALQSFISIDQIRHFFLFEKKYNNINNDSCGIFSIALKNLMLNLALALKKNQSFHPNIFEILLANFSTKILLGEQNDAHEFIYFLIQNINRELLNNTDENDDYIIIENSKSIINRLFCAILNSITKCYSCQLESIKQYTLYSIEICLLDHKKEISLEDCLKNYVKEDLLKDSRCEKCGFSLSLKYGFYYLPEICIILLKRFDNISNKNETFVKYPIDKLDLNEYMNNNNRNNKMEYELFSVIVHISYQNCGHYISYCKYYNKWYEFDDIYAREVNENIILSKDAYILFYRRKGQVQINPTGISKEEPYNIKNENNKIHLSDKGKNFGI